MKPQLDNAWLYVCVPFGTGLIFWSLRRLLPSMCFVFPRGSGGRPPHVLSGWTSRCFCGRGSSLAPGSRRVSLPRCRTGATSHPPSPVSRMSSVSRPRPWAPLSSAQSPSRTLWGRHDESVRKNPPPAPPLLLLPLSWRAHLCSTSQNETKMWNSFCVCVCTLSSEVMLIFKIFPLTIFTHSPAFLLLFDDNSNLWCLAIIVGACRGFFGIAIRRSLVVIVWIKTQWQRILEFRILLKVKTETLMLRNERRKENNNKPQTPLFIFMPHHLLYLWL